KRKSVRTIFEDRSGVVWVGTFDGLFEQRAGRFVLSEIGLVKSEYAGTHVTSMIQDRNGDLWIGARSGLYRRFPGVRQEHFTVQDGLPHKNVDALLEDRWGRIWAGTRDGIWVLDGTRRRVIGMQTD